MSNDLLNDLAALASGERIDLSVAEAAQDEIKRLMMDVKSLEGIIDRLERRMDGPDGLLAEVERLRTGLHRVSLASQNSMSSKDECGRIAREALEAKP